MKLEKLVSMIDKAEKGFDRYKGAFKELEDNYKGVMNKELKDELAKVKKSRLFISKINAKVKRVADTLSESYFNTNEFATVIANNDENKKEALLLQKAISKELDRLKFYSILSPVFHKIPFYGTVIMKVSWSDRLLLEDVKLEDIFFDPNAKDSTDMRYIVNNIYLTLDDVKAYQNAGVFKKDVDMNAYIKNSDYERVKLQDIYYQKDGVWYMSTIFDKKISLRKDIMLNFEHPFIIGILLPQIVGIDDEESVAVYGEPIIAPLLPLQKEINIRRNQQIDTINQILNPKIIIPANAGINPIDLLKPSGAIRSNTSVNLQVVPTPTIQPNLFDIDRLDDEMAEISGISSQINGMGARLGMTATESSILSNEGNIRLQSYLRSFNESFFEPLLKKIATYVWYFSEVKELKDIDKTTMIDIKVKVNTGLGATNKEVQKNGLKEAFLITKELLNIAQLTQDEELINRAKNTAIKITKEMLPLWGIKNVDDYLGEDNEQKGVSTTGVDSFKGLGSDKRGDGGYEKLPL